MRQEIVSDQEAKEHEVVHNALEVKGVGKRQILELEEQVLSDDRNLDKLELHCSRKSHLVFSVIGSALGNHMATLLTLVADQVLGSHHSFS